MIRNYLKLAFRHFTSQKAFSFLNVAGLAIGLASSIVIFLWVQDERSYDSFHPHSDRIYRLVADAGDLQVAVSPCALAPATQETFREVVGHTRLMNASGITLQNGDTRFEEEKAFYAEPSFFTIFDFPLSSGDAKTALTQPNGIVLSEVAAIKYFGTTDVMGKTLRKDNADDFVVTGILAPSQLHSHLQFDVLLPWSYIAPRDWALRRNSWNNFTIFSYLALDQPLNIQSKANFETKLGAFYKEHNQELQVSFILQPLRDIHLHSNYMGDVGGHGNAQYVTIFMVVAFFVLAIACINFMNLSTARSVRRAREVGLRKVVGAARAQLIGQFIGESLVVTLISFCVALLVVFLSLPYIGSLTGKEIFFNWSNPQTILWIGSTIVCTGILSGIYPAIILSSFSPSKVLKKDKARGVGGSLFRNTLVVAQFTIAIVLIIGTGVVSSQLGFIQEKNLGYNKDNLIHLQIRGGVEEHIDQWHSVLASNAATASASISSGLPTNLASGENDVSWQGKDPNKQVIFAELRIDENFIPTYNMTMLSGRNFQHHMIGDSTNFIVNETAVSLMGFTPESAIGQTIHRSDYHGTIVGVVKDFNFKPLQQAIEPMIMSCNTWGGTITLKTNPAEMKVAIEALESAWKQLSPAFPFSYGFVDQDLANLYKSEQQVGKLFTLFASLAILISCLGLYGLSAFIAEQRTREIGIRKAMGANIQQIILLLNKKFVLPVLVSVLLAAPIAWYAMVQWLQGFAYHTTFNWWLIPLAGSIAIGISLLTVTYESWRAALTDPVKSLRAE